MSCSDDSFKYTLHDHGVKKEKIGNNQDVYILLKDRMDFKLFKLESKLEKKMIKEYTWCFWASILMTIIMTIAINALWMGYK